jgi:heme-degrading monooxygenase HmoA
MIVRSWRGTTKSSDADEYFEYLLHTGVKFYQTTPGNLGVFVLKRDLEAKTEFLLLSLWESMEAVKRFAGPEPQRAVFYPEDEAFLVDYETTVDHYEVLHTPTGWPPSTFAG